MTEHEPFIPIESDESSIELFTVEDREAALRQLTEFGSHTPEVVGTMLVGSGAEGFRDNYSDVDVVYISEAHLYTQTLDAVTHFIAQDLKPIFFTNYQHREDVQVSTLLLENCLEIDIGVWSLSTLFASSSNWKIIQERGPESRQLIEEAMRTHPRLPREHEPIISGDNSLWQPLYGRFMAKLRSHQEKLVRHQHALSEHLGTTDEERNLSSVISDAYSPQQAAFLRKLLHENDFSH